MITNKHKILTRRILIAIFICAMPAASSAQDSPGSVEAAKPMPWEVGVTEDERRRAKILFEHGNNKFTDLRYQDALADYAEALKYWDHPRIHYQMTLAFFATGQYVSAYESSHRALRHGAEALDEKHHQTLLQKQQAIRARIAWIEVSCPMPGAVVTVDGEVILVGPGRHEHLVTAGDHEVVARKAGYITVATPLVLRGGEHRSLTLKPRAIDEARRWKSWLPWLVVGTGVGLSLGGTATLWKSQVTDRQAQNLFNNLYNAGVKLEDVDPRVRRLESKARSYSYASISLFTAGTLFMAAGAAMVWMNQPETRRIELADGMAVVPWISNRSVSVSTSLNF